MSMNCGMYIQSNRPQIAVQRNRTATDYIPVQAFQATKISQCLLILQKVGCDGVIGSNAVVDRCGLCNGDGSSCSPGSKADVTNVNTTSTKKAVTPGSGTSNLITSALNWLKRMGYDVDRRGQIASPESATKETEKDEFYWAVVKSGCSVSCGGGQYLIPIYFCLRLAFRLQLR